MSTTPVLQFGTSRFLQAHVDLLLSESLPGTRPVTVVQTSGDPSRAGRVAALANGFDVRIEGLSNGRKLSETRRVDAVARGLTIGADLDRVTRIIAEEARFILSNTADAGFRPRPEDGNARFDIAMSYPAKLAHLLRARFEAGGTVPQIMPTELIRANGDALRELVLNAARKMEPAYREWLTEEVVWVNSLVDRIVSEPLEPAGAVAEPYALWAIEAEPRLTLPCTHPCIDVVGDLGPIERRKLFVLNLSHTWIASRWLAGSRGGACFVRDVMADPDWSAELSRLYAEEVLPAFEAAGEAEGIEDYIAVTKERFANPFLDHKLDDIAQNHAEKLDRRISAFLDWARENGDATAKPRLTAALDRRTA